MHVLGIDAGGSKTVCLLADGQATVLASVRGPGANLQIQGELAVEKTLHDVMDRATTGRGIVPDAICLGIAGVDRTHDAGLINGIMRRIGYRQPTLVVNDAFIALVAGAGDAPGIVTVSGTGSICFGRDARGRAARADGWGHVMGDEGSAYWIARRALQAAARHVDGRGPATRLTAAVLAYFQAGAMPDVVHDLHTSAYHPRVAGLAEAVQTAALEGDVLARQILDEAANRLLEAAGAVATKLEMRGEAFPYVLAGGAFHALPMLRERILSGLAEVAPRCQPQLLTEEPALGAVRLALAHAQGSAVVPEYL